jgi:fructosamine-3-kinase
MTPPSGFSGAFWDAYHELIPRAPGWEERHQLYTLYHYLNHAVLFGGGYYGNCSRIMNDLVKKL